MALLAGPSAERARSAITNVARTLREPDPAWLVGPSLANGDAGLAIFFAYLAAAEPGRGYDDDATRFLERAIDALSADPMSPSLYHGFVGVAWAAEHLSGRLVDFGDDDPNEAIDAALLDHLRDARWTGDFDLMSGLVGIGAYALERWPRPHARELLELVIAQLTALAERRPDGVAWRTSLAILDPETVARFPEGVYNLGLAHGMPCVIALLAASVSRGIAAAGPLLADAVRWLEGCELPAPSSARYPDLMYPGTPAFPARHGWCYGDLSVAIPLLHAARAADRDDWRQHGLTLARGTLAQTATTGGVVDACLCHGAAGLGLMYHRAAQLTADPTLDAAAARWFEAALRMYAPSDPVGGFMPHIVSEIALGDAAVGILTGSAGVALALLAAISDAPPDWDRLMMLSEK